MRPRLSSRKHVSYRFKMRSESPSSTRVAYLAARDACFLFIPTLKRLWLVLLGFHAIELGFLQALGFLQEKAMERGTEDLFFIAVLVAWQLIFAAIWSAAYLSCVGGVMTEISENRKPHDWYWHLTQTLNQTLIETTRAWASILRWCVALILPGAVAYGRLFWAPLFAALDSRYDRGEIDALKASREITRGKWWLTFLIGIASLALPEGLGLVAQGSEDRLLANPLGVMGAELIGAVVTLWCFGWAVSAFRILTAPARAREKQRAELAAQPTASFF